MASTTRKYRIYPTESQINNLENWSNIYRFVWNCCLEERFYRAFTVKEISLSKNNKPFVVVPTSYQQNPELTQIKKIEGFEWLNKPPGRSIVEIGRRLDTAWDRWWRKQANGHYKKPHFKNKNQFISSYVQWQETTKLPIQNGFLQFPKLGLIKIKYHRSLPSVPKSITINKNAANQWFAVLTCEEEKKFLPKTNKSVGIDLGVSKFVTLVDTTNKAVVISNPKNVHKLERKRKKLERKLAKQVKGSNRQKITRAKINKLWLKSTNQTEDLQHKTSFAIVSNYDTIVLEDLKVSNMISSAKGTVENPGKNVKAKSGLNREISRIGFHKFKTMIEYKSNKFGRTVVSINPAYTSQTCSKCGYCDKENRKSQAYFKCLKCNFVVNADINAAKNILDARLQNNKKKVVDKPNKKK